VFVYFVGENGDQPWILSEAEPVVDELDKDL